MLPNDGICYSAGILTGGFAAARVAAAWEHR